MKTLVFFFNSVNICNIGVVYFLFMFICFFVIIFINLVNSFFPRENFLVTYH